MNPDIYLFDEAALERDELVVRHPLVRSLVQDAVAAGAQVQMAPNGHIEVRWDGQRVMISSTPHSRRSVLNDRSRLRRAGLQV